MSRTDSRAAIRELKADLERNRADRNAVRDRRSWGTFASHKTVRALKRAGNKTRRYQGRREITRDLES
jgi:hypothetical protein